MKSIYAFLVFFTLLSFIFELTIYGQPTRFSPEVQARILKVENSLAGPIRIKDDPMWSLRDRMQYYKVMGLSIAVVNNFQVEWAKGYGIADTAEQRDVTASTIFQAGSVSKSLNSLGVLKLVDDNKIDLNADINTYLSSKFNYDSISNGKKITPLQLISHTSGLSVRGFDGYERGDSIPTIYEIIVGQKPANSPPILSMFEPGLKFQYSGGGSTVSQLMIADVAKMNYEKFMLDSILKPIGMTNSFFGTPIVTTNKIQELATAYSPTGAELPGKYKIHPEMAAAGLWTTPTDIAKFIVESQLSYEGKSNKILTKETTQLMLDPSVITKQANLPEYGGMGVFIDEKKGNRYFLHKGGNVGFVCIYYGSMKGGNGVAVMINSNNDKILQEVVNSVAQVYDWEGFYNPILKEFNPVGDRVLESYVGNYEFAPNVILAITKVGDHLQAKATGFKEFEVFSESESKFFAKDFNAEIEFVKDEKNKVCGLKYGLDGMNDSVRKRLN